MSSNFEFGGLERRSFKTETRSTGTGLKVVGHAAVFGSPSVEMRSRAGNFTEYIAAGAFDAVLRTGPDVLLTWDHDLSKVLARTGNGSLELRTDAKGLRYFASLADVSYAHDLHELMRTGIVQQSSFLFSVAEGGESWQIAPNGLVERTITRVGQLVDVCVTASGAYKATDVQLARTAVAYAAERGFITDPSLALAKRKALSLARL